MPERIPEQEEWMLLGQTGREFQSETSKETCHSLKQWDLLAAGRNNLIFHVSAEQKPVGGVSIALSPYSLGFSAFN